MWRKLGPKLKVSWRRVKCQNKNNRNSGRSATDIRDVVRQTIQEFVQAEQRKAEPAYKAELQEERKRRESLEGRLNQLVEENQKARAMADEAVGIHKFAASSNGWGWPSWNWRFAR